jgi:hypothetical protein
MHLFPLSFRNPLILWASSRVLALYQTPLVV